MKRHGYLFQRIVSFQNLFAASRKALRGKWRRPEAEAFFFHLEDELLALHRELSSRTYRPGPYRCFWVFDPKRRRISAAPLRDRVVHHAICRVTEPFFDNLQSPLSFACRRGKGQHAAVKLAQTFARNSRFVLRMDIRKFFDSIQHAVLKRLLEKRFKDRELLELLFRLIEHTPAELASGRGLPIGNLTSQHFANSYLNGLDRLIVERLGIHEYLRYMDDLAVFAKSKSELHGCHSEVRHYLSTSLGLDLKEQATIVAPVTEGFPFLGCRVFPGIVRVKSAGKIRFYRKWGARQGQYAAGVLSDYEFLQSAASLVGHLRHADTRNLRRAFFWGQGQRGLQPREPRRQLEQQRRELSVGEP